MSSRNTFKIIFFEIKIIPFALKNNRGVVWRYEKYAKSSFIGSWLWSCLKFFVNKRVIVSPLLLFKDWKINISKLRRWFELYSRHQKRCHGESRQSRESRQSSGFLWNKTKQKWKYCCDWARSIFFYFLVTSYNLENTMLLHVEVYVNVVAPCINLSENSWSHSMKSTFAVVCFLLQNYRYDYFK